MATLKAFNEMMGQFLDDISSSFPEEEAIKNAKSVPREGRDAYDKFMKQIGPWMGPMMARDEKFFCEENEFAKELNLHVIWKREDCTPQCKSAIWQWLSSMYMITVSMSMFPPDTLAALESAAENVAKKMQKKAGGGQPMNDQMLMSGVNDMMAQLMNSGSGNPFAALMGQQPAQPRRQRKPSKKSR